MSDGSLSLAGLRPAAALGLLLVVVAAIYAPILDDHFTSDDYQNLGLARQNSLSLSGLFAPSNVHLLPVTRLLWEIEYALFGISAPGYHAVSLALHLANTLLLGWLVRRWTGEGAWALGASATFALTASHWRTTMWIATQAQQLAVLWLLVALALWLAYLESGRRWQLAGAVLAHLLMTFSFTAGVELPLLLGLGVVLLGGSASDKGSPLRRRARRSLVPFLAVSAFYLAVRVALMPGASGLPARLGDWTGLVRSLPEALRFLAGGLAFGYSRSLSGAYFRADGPLPWLWLVQVGLVGVAAAVAIARTRASLVPHRRLLLGCALGTILLYAPAAFGRLTSEVTFEYFVTRSRYLYIPSLPLALLVAIASVEIYRALGRSGNRGAQRVVILAALFVATMNIYELERRAATVDASTHAFQTVEARFATDLRRALATSRGRLLLVDRLAGGADAAHYAGWNVTSRHLAMVHLAPHELRRVAFVAADEAGSLPLGAYDVADGKLVASPRP